MELGTFSSEDPAPHEPLKFWQSFLKERGRGHIDQVIDAIIILGDIAADHHIGILETPLYYGMEGIRAVKRNWLLRHNLLCADPEEQASGQDSEREDLLSFTTDEEGRDLAARLRAEREVNSFSLKPLPAVAKHRDLESPGLVNKKAVHDVTGSAGREHQQSEGCDTLKTPGIGNDMPPSRCTGPSERYQSG